VLVGRGVLKKEDVEQLDEVGDTPAGRKALGSYVMKALHDKDRQKGVRKATSRLYKDNYYGKKTNEEVEEQIDEAFPTVADAAKRLRDAESSKFEKQKSSKGTIYTKKHTEKDAEYEAPKPAGRKRMIGKGSDNPDHMRKMKMTEMLEAYQEGGLKALNSMLVVEEPDNEQFTKEFEDQKASMEGKKKQPSVAAAATKGVKEMPEEAEVDPDDFISETEESEIEEEVKDEYARKVDKYLKKKYNKEEVEHLDEAIPKSTNHALVHSSSKKIIAKGNKAEMMKKMKELNAKEKNSHHLGMTNRGKVGDTFGEEVELDERTLTKGEAETKEKYVKGMKKGLAGFKARYGERAKSVMYATATKMAKKD